MTPKPSASEKTSAVVKPSLSSGTGGRKTKRPLSVPEFYALLRAHFGHRNWWPGDTTDEILIGALLTQNTSWRNVEKAIAELRTHNLLSLKAISGVAAEDLAPLIRSSGYYNQKAKKLLGLAEFFQKACDFKYDKLRKAPLGSLRESLLAVKGVGPETADSMLNYALDHLVFVVDAYTRRISHRLGFTAVDEDYHALQRYYQAQLDKNLDLYQDMHAQLVALGHNFCSPKPQCEGCPVRSRCLVGRGDVALSV